MAKTTKKTETKMVEKCNINQAINDKLNDVLTIDSNSFYETIESETGTVDIVKKSYDLVNPIGKRTTMTIYDQNIIESVERIDKALTGKTLLTYVICKEFSKIAKTGKLENMGFKNIAEFGKAKFGLETSTVNHYARIGENFIGDDYNVKAGLPNLSVSHFIELSSQVKDEGDITPIIELYTNGTLTDGMSTKAMRKAIKDLSSNTLEDKSSNEENQDSVVTDNSENEATVIMSETETQELQANFDKQVAIGKIINACSVVETLFEMLNEHEIEVIGYADNINSIKALAKALL